MDVMVAQGQPIVGYGLGPASQSAATATAARPAITAGAGMVGFTRSAAFGLLLGIVAVVYIDGRILPRKKG
jgi:hypothetical protein